MQQALQRHAAAYLSVHRPDAVQRTVLNRLLACRTAALGGHLLRPVALRNPNLVYAAMFEAAAHVLQTLAHQKLEALLGVTAVLHTWASDLRHHPHVHCLVTAGGLDAATQTWHHTKPDFLFFEPVMAAMFKGRLMATLRAALADGTLRAPGDDAAQLRRALCDAGRKRVRWVVDVEPPQGRDAHFAARYLARYARGVAIADARVLAVSDTRVTIATKIGPVTLDGPEFVRRFLVHVLPPDFRKIRHYGLYAPGGAARLRETGIGADLRHADRRARVARAGHGRGQRDRRARTRSRTRVSELRRRGAAVHLAAGDAAHGSLGAASARSTVRRRVALAGTDHAVVLVAVDWCACKSSTTSPSAPNGPAEAPDRPATPMLTDAPHRLVATAPTEPGPFSP